ncbi:MAG: hypothetical protein VX641_01490 [Planctomycetota bacterium]|nr:hypothetical protein [Planctomycetota bacterium]
MLVRTKLLLLTFGLSPILVLGGCGTGAITSTTSLGAVRGQEVQAGQSTEVRMTRQQAEAMMNANNVSLGTSNEEIPGKPDVAAQQGATPPGVGYDNIPGVQYDPALGTLHYGDGVQHHIVHHVHYNASAGATSAPAPTGYVQGGFEIPNNENPNARRGGYGSVNGRLGGASFSGIQTNGYGIPVQHTYSGTRPRNARYGGSYGADRTNDGTGVPRGFYVNGGGGLGTDWRGRFGSFHPMALNGTGVTSGFTD